MFAATLGVGCGLVCSTKQEKQELEPRVPGFKPDRLTITRSGHH